MIRGDAVTSTLLGRFYVVETSKSGVLNLYSLIYPLANSISKIYPQMFLYFFTSTNAYCNK